MAHRSHDQIPASHWSKWQSKKDPKSGDQKRTPKVAVKKGPQKWRSKVDPQPLQNCIGPTICIGREIRCHPYAGFFLSYLKLANSMPQH